jgi:carbon monoxide dehydrogenase subunit G
MLIDGSFVVRAPAEQVLARLFDARAMASCLPGCESIEALSDDRYHAVVAIALAGVKARFDLQVEITSREPDGVRAVTRGEEGGNASTLEATSEVRLSAVAEGTRVDYRSEVAVTGRLGRFALGMMKKKAQSIGDEFASNLQAQLTADRPELSATMGAGDIVPGAEPLAPEQMAANDRRTLGRDGESASEPVGSVGLGQRLWAWLRRLFASRGSAGHTPH